MAERACHAFGSTTRFGLTQALGRMESTSEMTDRLDLCARSICIIPGAVFAFVAWLAYTSSGPAIVYWLCGVGVIVLLTAGTFGPRSLRVGLRSEEHTSELQSLMRISYAVFCLK